MPRATVGTSLCTMPTATLRRRLSSTPSPTPTAVATPTARLIWTDRKHSSTDRSSSPGLLNSESMAMAAPDWVQPAVKLASSWVFPTVALSSLVAHLLLVFFSGIRRRQAYGVRRFLLWLAYQVNNWAPIYVLGNLYFDTEPQEKQLYAFWVPFLMLHLARPDNISAYSMEDNALAGRVMLFVPFQSMGAFTIIYRYIHVDSTAGTLRPASWIMFSLACFKYVESVMALRGGDLDNIRSSFKPTSRVGTQDHRVAPEDDKYLLFAHGLLDICKGAFTDYPVKMDDRERQRVDYFGWEKMPQVVEMELSLMFDILYTKAAMVHTWGGYGIRVVSPFLTAVAFLLFWFRHREQGGSIAAEMSISATWKRTRRLVVSLDTSRLSISGCELLRDKKASSYRTWSGIIGQHNLLGHCRDTESRCSKLAKCIGLEESWNEHCYSGPRRGLDLWRQKAVRKVLFERIWSLVLILAKEEEGKKAEPPAPPTGHQRRRDLDRALGFDPEIEEVVLIWHIAAEVFLSKIQNTAQERSTDQTENVIMAREKDIRVVSDYMLFLIAVRPAGMISGLTIRSLYEDTRSSLNTLWGGGCASPTAGVDNLQLAQILQEKIETHSKIRRKLQGMRSELFGTKLDIPDMIDLIFDVWVRLLIYVSIRCSRDSHAKQLGRGGELTTIVWILAQHGGMFRQRRG
uniref:Uncharacterized protein n=1 Tax=Avena sativa TaxID=4498 RepID=A0ACD5YQP2_AVESA